ncbi:MAG: XTP/dITP diphosphatase [Candidatus Thermoplasmatota archaeon]
MKDLYFITSNKGKYKEVANKLIEADFKVIQKNLGYPEVQANSLEDVVNFGVSYILERFHKPFIIEDAGIFIKNLNDFPGVYSADVFYKIGCKGILKLLDGIKKDRGACFKSVIAYVNSDKQIHVFAGECFGHIGFEEVGDNGFGYDPVFVPKGENKTFAEMTVDEKNRFSHRGNSLDRLLEFIKE